jgi:hypothetical protein
VAVPPLVEPPRLLAASDHVLTDTEGDEDLRLQGAWLVAQRRPSQGLRVWRAHAKGPRRALAPHGFNVLVSNTDDHLRHHGILYQGTDGWERPASR